MARPKAVSEFLIDRYVDWGLPREKFRMIENGMRQGKRFIMVGQNADEWLPIRPGSEAMVALGMGGVGLALALTVVGLKVLPFLPTKA